MATTMEVTSPVKIHGPNGVYLYHQFISQVDGQYFVTRRKELPPEDGDRKPKYREMILPIHPNHYRPVVLDNFTLADPATAQYGYIKNTSPLLLRKNINPKEAVFREILACETIRRHPHHNLAMYRGCLVTDGRVSALVFERHVLSLMEQLNPDGMSKADFVKRHTLDLSDVTNVWINRITEGVRHLHSLGIAHNDLSPSKIMLTAFGGIAIVGFDSCLPFGAPLAGVKRTPGWHNPAERQSHPRNDWAALKEIGIWLEKDPEDPFQFGEE